MDTSLGATHNYGLCCSSGHLTIYSNLEVILELVEEMKLIPADYFLRISSLDSAM